MLIIELQILENEISWMLLLKINDQECVDKVHW
jgi:hypothetical protein